MPYIHSSTTIGLTEIQIDPEFASLCPPLSPDEFETLEENIVSEGCRDALVVWAEQNTLLDGHNRKRICDEHGIDYDVIEVSLPDRDSAIAWVLRNQLGRRNLHPDAASLMRGRLYNMQKRDWGGDRKSKCQSDTLNGDAADRLSAELGVSAPTIKRDGAFAQAVDTLAPYAPDLPKRVMAGDVPSRKAVIEAARELDKDNGLSRDALTAQRVEATIFSSRSEEYYTPAEYIEAARQVLGGIDLDPASCEMAQETVRAAQFYTKETDGLMQPWSGRVWLNPPYGTTGGESNQGIWARKLIEEHQSGNVPAAILLVKAALGYEWFECLWYEWPVCFPRRRLSFTMPDGSDDGQSKQASALFYFGDNLERFREVFRQFGRIIMPEDGPDETL